MLSHLYPAVRPCLFRMNAEQAHHRTLTGLRMLERMGLSRALVHKPVIAPRTLMGLTFRNSVGLAAGLDKEGSCIDGLAALGFGFLEVGTVTPRPQAGNPRPRLFRLPEASALINRMGFNNSGIERYIANIEQSRYTGVLGFNLGKNADTPLERAADDYLYCLEQVYLLATRISSRISGYVAINISSPNTKNLRQLQSGDQLDALLSALDQKQQQLADRHNKKIPLVLKIAPDLDDEQIKAIAAAVLRYRIDGVIATNTTLSRSAVAGLPHADEAGGLSGRPVLDVSTSVIRKLHAELGNEIPIIGVGGIFSAADAQAKIAAGASLIQLYTGLIYRGPALINECAQALSRLS